MGLPSRPRALVARTFFEQKLKSPCSECKALSGLCSIMALVVSCNVSQALCSWCLRVKNFWRGAAFGLAEAVSPVKGSQNFLGLSGAPT